MKQTAIGEEKCVSARRLQKTIKKTTAEKRAKGGSGDDPLIGALNQEKGRWKSLRR